MKRLLSGLAIAFALPAIATPAMPDETKAISSYLSFQPIPNRSNFL